MSNLELLSRPCSIDLFPKTDFQEKNIFLYRHKMALVELHLYDYASFDELVNIIRWNPRLLPFGFVPTIFLLRILQ